MIKKIQAFDPQPSNDANLPSLEISEQTSALDSGLVQPLPDDFVNAGGVRLKKRLENPPEPTAATPVIRKPLRTNRAHLSKTPGARTRILCRKKPMPPPTSPVKQKQNPTEPRST